MMHVLSPSHIASLAEQVRREHPEPIVTFEALPCDDTLALYEAIHLAGKVAMPLPVGAPKSLKDEATRLLASAPPSGTADVLYTTGSTGEPKAVVLSHNAIRHNAEHLLQGQPFHSNLRVLLIGPLNHIGTLSKYWAARAAKSVVQIVPDALKDPDILFRTIHDSAEPVALFLVPTQIQMLLRLAPDLLQRYAAHIGILETGAAPIAASTMEQIAALMPATPLFNTYASTEAGIVATQRFNVSDAYCQPDLVGKPLGACCLSFSSDDEHIVVNSPTVMTGYLGDEETTARLLPSPHVLHTSDIGSLDNLGRLHLTGRTSDVINTGGFKTSPRTVEEVLLQHPAVAEVLCVPTPHSLLGQVPHVVVAPREGQTLTPREVIAHLRPLLEPHQLPQKVTIVPAIEHLPNGKQNRKMYM